MKSVTRYKLLAPLVLLIMLAGCKQPETIVVDDNPTVAASDTTVEDQPDVDEADFQKLVIGEYNTIPSLDPLFADNAATMRAIQLVFEGLVRLDADGSVIPGMAENWEVSSDSLTYTFQLRNNLYYHDSDIFSTGTGRRITSGDVKFVFERMAQPEIPSKAAHLFMEIKGFDPYFHEQHEVYLPSQRKLDGVSGIQTPADSTVVFELVNQDPDFLKKLATPLAVIYPQEAVGESPESFSAVGTGPFRFSSQPSDTVMIFSKFQNYYAAPEIQLNRVDVVNGISETDLFREMSTGDIHATPQLGPQMIETLLDTSGTLSESYTDRYNLATTDGFSEFVFRYYPAGDLAQQNAQALAGVARSHANSFLNKFPGMLVSTAEDTTESISNFSIQTDQLYTAFFEDPFVQTYLSSLSKALGENDIQLQMVEIRAPSRNTSLFFSQNYPLIPDSQWDSYPELSWFRVNQAALQRTEITGLNFNRYPWWLDLRGVSLPNLIN